MSERLDAIERTYRREEGTSAFHRPCDVAYLVAVSRAAERLVADDYPIIDGGWCSYCGLSGGDPRYPAPHDPDCLWLALRDALAGAEEAGRG